jgi:hypothetical protein
VLSYVILIQFRAKFTFVVCIVDITTIEPQLTCANVVEILVNSLKLLSFMIMNHQKQSRCMVRDTCLYTLTAVVFTS